MSKNIRRETPNRLLSWLSAEDFGLLEPSLKPVNLPLRMQLENRNRKIEHVYFIEHGFASVVATGPNRRSVEVGIIGWEGVTGLAVIMAADRSPNETYMQSAGSGQRIASANLRTAMAQSATLRGSLLNYGHTFIIQTAYTALSNNCSRVDERLARWLLMAQDRAVDDELHLTHEFLAIMLGVRRAGVTTALSHLKSKGLIRTKRGSIVVVNRGGLEKLAFGTYGAPEAEFKRLFN